MAVNSSTFIPHVTERPMLSTGASTEKMPLMPQAQGTNRASPPAFSLSSAVGTNVPISSPSGITKPATIIARAMKGKATHDASLGRIKRCSSSRTPAKAKLTIPAPRKVRTMGAEKSDPNPVDSSRTASTTESA